MQQRIITVNPQATWLWDAGIRGITEITVAAAAVAVTDQQICGAVGMSIFDMKMLFVLFDLVEGKPYELLAKFDLLPIVK